MNLVNKGLGKGGLDSFELEYEALEINWREKRKWRGEKRKLTQRTGTSHYG